jgi:hypothetical protein
LQRDGCASLICTLLGIDFQFSGGNRIRSHLMPPSFMSSPVLFTASQPTRSASPCGFCSPQLAEGHWGSEADSQPVSPHPNLG